MRIPCEYHANTMVILGAATADIALPSQSFSESCSHGSRAKSLPVDVGMRQRLQPFTAEEGRDGDYSSGEEGTFMIFFWWLIRWYSVFYLFYHYSKYLFYPLGDIFGGFNREGDGGSLRSSRRDKFGSGTRLARSGSRDSDSLNGLKPIVHIFFFFLVTPIIYFPP